MKTILIADNLQQNNMKAIHEKIKQIYGDSVNLISIWEESQHFTTALAYCARASIDETSDKPAIYLGAAPITAHIDKTIVVNAKRVQDQYDFINFMYSGNFVKKFPLHLQLTQYTEVRNQEELFKELQRTLQEVI